MQQSVMENCKLIHYADDTMIFGSQNDLTEARNNLQQTIESLVNFFESPVNNQYRQNGIYLFL